MDDIIKFLDFDDPALEVGPICIKDGKRHLTIQKKLTEQYCPFCNYRMYSRGIYERKVNHPIMQDGLPLVLHVRQRRWRCTNTSCQYTCNDTFSFLEAHKQNTKMTDILIVEAFRDDHLPAAKIARRCNVSGTYAIHTFARFVDMKRRQFSEVISIDEVKVDVTSICKYALVIQDFITGEPIDLLPNRRQEITEPYFLSIPLAERRRVRYLISDMYKPYIGYVEKYFPNAISAVDSFHVVKYINGKLLAHLRQLARELDQKDRLLHEQREQQFHRRLTFHHSRDYYIVKHFQWVILKNQSDLRYDQKPFWNPYLQRYLDIYAIEDLLFKIDPDLKRLRDLKERYIHFNASFGNDHKRAHPALRELIRFYRDSPFKEFRDVADTLEYHFESIINSFIMVERYCTGGVHVSRLSNGPMESLNRIAKDLKRNGHGYRNFDHLRNRFLFARRKNARMLAVPKPLQQVVPTGKPRGPYKT